MPIVAFGWVTQDGSTLPYLVTYYTPHGTLPEYLRRIATTAQERRELALDVAAGLQALHQCKVIHGDVKPGNVIVVDALDGMRPQMAVLNDFGSSLFELDGAEDPVYCGTVLYRAPELHVWRDGETDEEAPYAGMYAADVFSFGLTLWETMKCGRCYIDDELLGSGESRLDWLADVYGSGSDRLLSVAINFFANARAEDEEDVWSDVSEAFKMSLNSSPSQRSEMFVIVDRLSMSTE